jgi:DNA excision repair protein ERCC-4
VKLVVDSREPPWADHPWRPFLPVGIEVDQRGLETGDFAIAGFEHGAVIERKTRADFLACIGRERGRFDRELLRARYVERFCIAVEASLADVLIEAGGLHPHAVIGSVAAWTRRGWPVVFADSPRLAAQFAWRFLSQPIGEAQRLIRATTAA